MTTTLPTASETARAVDATPRPEYPRPQFDRSHSWRSLNGQWEFRRGVAGAEMEPITVPFAWETRASGIEAHWLEHAEYRREFGVPEAWDEQRIVLHFGAVHHAATVSVNGRVVGTHIGGSTPFEFDITDALTGFERNVLEVAVNAPSDKRFIAHGKQRSTPRDDYDSCAFTPSSGIWQSVWLEARPATHIRSLVLRPTADLRGIRVSGAIDGDAPVSEVRIHVSSQPAQGAGDQIASTSVSASAFTDGVLIEIDHALLWSPASPNRYSVRVEAVSDAGVDEVSGSTGLRRIETRDGRIFLNGEQISLRGVLDQGYWPESGITAPDLDALALDLQIARDAGFTLVRKHLKLEDPWFHELADRMGMLVWAEPAGTGRYSDAGAAAFEAQIGPMVQRDGNHPSIVVWGLYNEEWGLDWDLPGDPAKQEAVRRAVALLRKLDDSRPIVDNSGWTHLQTDLVDWHVYDEHPAGWARKVAALVADDEPSFPVAIAVGTIVQKRLMVEGAVPRDAPFINSEFGGGWTSLDRGWNLHWQTQELRRHDTIAGWVWTELADIEHESAGVVATDRTLKDHGGRPPAHANGETATVFDLVPDAPGRDLISLDGAVRFGVHVSHHGTSPIEVVVAIGWSGVYAEQPVTSIRDIATLSVEPFRLSDAVTIDDALPAGWRSGRIHVLLRSATDGAIVGRGAVDVVRD